MIGWTMHSQQQQRGAQIPRQAKGDAPDEAVNGREAQDHEFADQDAAPGAQPEPGDYPASRMPDSNDEPLPRAPATGEGTVEWDDIVQPEDRRRPQGERES